MAGIKRNSIDLNLLIVFDSIMRERSVTRAGHELGLSQSALSHALTRLRHLLKDDLFVRSPGGMVPTPRAEQLALPVREALNGLQRSLEPPGFDPILTPRSFKLATDNYGALVLVGPLASRVAKVAPEIRLDIFPSGIRNVLDLLDRGELDLAIGSYAPQAERFSHQPLLRDRFIAVVREGHPAIPPSGITLEVLASIPHLDFTSIRYETDFVDTALARANLTRRIALRAPLMSFVRVLLESDMVAILPYRIAHNITQNRSLTVHDLPHDSPPIDTSMIWPRWFDDQPAHRWLRDHIAQVGNELTLSSPI